MQLAILREASKIRVSDTNIKPAVNGDKIYRFYLIHTGKGIALPFEPLQKTLSTISFGDIAESDFLKARAEPKSEPSP